MTVYIVNFENSSGDGIVKVFSDKEKADKCLQDLLDRFVGAYLDEDTTKAERRMIYSEHKQYGAFTGRISKREVQ